MRIATFILLMGLAFLASKMGYLPDYRTIPAHLVGGILFTAVVILFVSRS